MPPAEYERTQAEVEVFVTAAGCEMSFYLHFFLLCSPHQLLLLKANNKQNIPSPHRGTPLSQGTWPRGSQHSPTSSSCPPGPLGTRVCQCPARAGGMKSRCCVHPTTSGVGRGDTGTRMGWGGLFLIHLQPKESWELFYNETQELPTPLLAHLSLGANARPTTQVERLEGFPEAEKRPAPRPSLQGKHRKSAGPCRAHCLCGPRS